MKEDWDKRIGMPDEIVFRSETRSKILEILFVKLGGKKENIGAADEIMSLIESELDKKYLHEDAVREISLFFDQWTMEEGFILDPFPNKHTGIIMYTRLGVENTKLTPNQVWDIFVKSPSGSDLMSRLNYKKQKHESQNAH